jgi:hypothetical protein
MTLLDNAGGLRELMTRSVRPASPAPDVVKGREGRQVDEEEKRIFHQGPKARSCPHREAGYMTASVPTRASVMQAPLDIAGGSIYDNARSRGLESCIEPVVDITVRESHGTDMRVFACPIIVVQLQQVFGAHQLLE